MSSDNCNKQEEDNVVTHRVLHIDVWPPHEKKTHQKAITTLCLVNHPVDTCTKQVEIQKSSLLEAMKVGQPREKNNDHTKNEVHTFRRVAVASASKTSVVTSVWQWSYQKKINQGFVGSNLSVIAQNPVDRKATQGTRIDPAFWLWNILIA